MAEWEEKEGGGTRPSMRTIHHQSSPVTLWTTLPLSRQSRDGRRTNQLSRLLSLLLLLLLLLLFTTILPSCQLVIQPGPPFQLIPWTTTTTTTIHRFLVSSSFPWWWLLSVDFVSQLFLRGFGRDVLVDWVNGFHGKISKLSSVGLPSSILPNTHSSPRVHCCAFCTIEIGS